MRSTFFAFASLAPLTVALCAAAACGGSAGPAPATPAQPSASATPTQPESSKVTWKKDAALARCHNDVKTGADLVAGVTAMAKGCAAQTKMHMMGETVQGTRQSLDAALAIPLHAEANHCYRVYGLSEDSLQDLDIAIIDSTGKSAGEDGSDSPDAVVLEDGAVCFTQSDDVKINVVAGSGNGKFAVQVWGD